MRPATFEVKRRVWVGLASALVVTVAWWQWNRIQLPVSPRTQQPRQPLVRFVGNGAGVGDRLVREQTELFDPTPLFFPTEWNYGQRPLSREVEKLPGEVFGEFAPKLAVAEQAIASFGAELAAVPEKLSDVLVQGNEAPFAGMGQIDVSKSTLPVRAGFLEVRDIRIGKIILQQSLTGIEPPRSDYAPVEFLVVVDHAGLIGEPVLTSGSGWDEVDAFFRTYLVRTYHLGERLPAGRYRVVVGT